MILFINPKMPPISKNKTRGMSHSSSLFICTDFPYFSILLLSKQQTTHLFFISLSNPFIFLIPIHLLSSSSSSISINFPSGFDSLCNFPSGFCSVCNIPSGFYPVYNIPSGFCSVCIIPSGFCSVCNIPSGFCSVCNIPSGFSMKQIMNGGGGGGGLRIPTAAEAQVAEILINMKELIKRRSFTWGMKKKRSVLVSKSESETRRRVGGGSPEKAAAAAAEADKSPTTPLCFLPPVKKNIKRKAADDLVESYNRMQQEKEILLRETKAMKTLHQGLTFKNMELKAIIQKVKYSRNIEDFHQWNNSRKIIDQQSYYPQISMFAPPTQQHQHQQQHCQQLVVDPNNWCSVNSHGGGRFGLFNQVDPRVKVHDFMGCSQPLDQSKYMMVDNHLTVRSAAAAARQRRILRMKENKRVSRGCR